jgi:outer membrane protein assembly factor BamB
LNWRTGSVVIAVIVILVVVGSIAAYTLVQTSTTTGSSETSTNSVSTSSDETVIVSTGRTSTATSSIVNTGQAWLTYHYDLARSGFVSEPSSLSVTPSFDWKSQMLDGAIYAEPLAYDGMVFAATENNSVYALNVTSGSIIWHENLGAPVTSGLPCGDINPSGITGTPVIDPDTSTVYVVAYLQQGGHELFALNVASGHILSERNVDPSGVSVSVEQERGALALSRGMVYVPYGGLFGDCGQYHGFVVGAPENDSKVLSYQVPTGREGGIWASSGMAVDFSGNVFVATGNSGASTNFDFGNAVIRLSPSLQEESYFAPENWVSLNSGDTDLGSVGPALLDDHTIFQIGKDGVGYLLDANNLGGIGGEEFSAQVCSGAYGGTAFASSVLYVPCTDGVFALEMNLTSHSFSKLWNGPQYAAGPPIVSGGVVWDVAVDSGMLYALNQTTGSTIFTNHIGGVAHFVTPSSAYDRIFVGASDSIESIMI